MSFRNPVRLATYAAVFALAAVALLLPYNCPTALASHTPEPTSVTIAGSLQSELGCGGDWDPGCAATDLTFDATAEFALKASGELGCGGDWDPGCAATHLTFDANDGVWQGTFNV